MACDTRRGKMCGRLATATGMTADEQEQVYATANGQAARQRAAGTRTAAEDSLAGLHARQMMDIYREAGIPIPTHAKDGMPAIANQAGHAAMRRTLKCAVCGKFTGLAGCQDCTANGMGATGATGATVSVPATDPYGMHALAHRMTPDLAVNSPAAIDQHVTAIQQAFVPQRPHAGGAYGELDDRSPGGWQRLSIAAAAMMEEPSTRDTEDGEAACMDLLERAQEANPHMMAHVRSYARQDTVYGDDSVQLFIATPHGRIGMTFTVPAQIERAIAWVDLVLVDENIGPVPGPDGTIHLHPVAGIANAALAETYHVRALQYLDQRVDRRRDTDVSGAFTDAVRRTDSATANPILRNPIVRDMALHDAADSVGLDIRDLYGVLGNRTQSVAGYAPLPYEQFPNHAEVYATLHTLPETQVQRAADPVCQEQDAWANRLWEAAGTEKPPHWDGALPGEQVRMLARLFPDGTTMPKSPAFQDATHALMQRYYPEAAFRTTLPDWNRLYEAFPEEPFRVWNMHAMAVAAEGRYGTVMAKEMMKSRDWSTFVQDDGRGMIFSAAEEAVYDDIAISMRTGAGEMNARQVRSQEPFAYGQAYTARLAGVQTTTSGAPDRAPTVGDVVQMRDTLRAWVSPSFESVPVPEVTSQAAMQGTRTAVQDAGHRAQVVLQTALRFLPHTTTQATFVEDWFAHDQVQRTDRNG